MRRIEEAIRGFDGRIHGAEVRVQLGTRISKVLRQLIQLLHPLEICSQEESRPPSEVPAKADNISHSPGQDDLQNSDTSHSP